MGAIFTLLPFTNDGSLLGNPAPDIIRSTPALTASFTYVSYSFIATIKLIPIIPPFEISLALEICFFIALKFAFIVLVSKSSSSYPI